MKLSHTHIVRNVVEVCAIIVAGAWAFYVFAYQNVILPSLAPPNPTFSFQMRHVGNDGPLAVVRIDETIRNIGTVPIHFLGHAVTVIGTKVVQSTPEPEPVPSPGEVWEYSRFPGERVVYRDVLVTNQGDPKQTTGMDLQPSQEITISREFYVPRDRFDRLVAWLVAGYTKDERRIPTAVRVSQKTGVSDLVWSGNNLDLFEIRQPTTQIDLKAE